MEKIVEKPVQNRGEEMNPFINPSESVKRLQFKSEIPANFFDLSNPAEVSFSEDTNYMTDPTENPAVYTFHPDFASKVYSASTEIHQMAYLATEKVISSDDLLEKFQIPSVFWQLIRNS